MNGELVKNAVSADQGGFLRKALLEEKTDEDRIERLFLATLGREPNRTESTQIARAFKPLADPQKLEAYQDLFWALLNSNEFILDH
jgi:hypothetical protein